MFKPQMDRAATRRADYPAMGGNQLVAENPQVVQAGLGRQRLWSQIIINFNFNMKKKILF